MRHLIDYAALGLALVAALVAVGAGAGVIRERPMFGALAAIIGLAAVAVAVIGIVSVPSWR